MLLPILYGELGLSGDEIARMTPWEAEQRLRGYQKRMKNRRAFTASFVTAPIINSGFKAPKHPVMPERLVPDAFRKGVTPSKRKRLMKFAEEMERRRALNRGNT